MQDLGSEAEPLHHSGPEVLHQHVGPLGHLQQQLPPLGGLQVEGNAQLVGVQHEEGEPGTRDLRLGSLAVALAPGRLDLDHPGAGLSEKQSRIRRVVDLAEVNHRHAVEKTRTRLFNEAGVRDGRLLHR